MASGNNWLPHTTRRIRKETETTKKQELKISNEKSKIRRDSYSNAMGRSRNKKKSQEDPDTEQHGIPRKTQQGEAISGMSSLQAAMMRDSQGNKKTGTIPWVANQYLYGDEEDSDPEDTRMAEDNASATNESVASRGSGTSSNSNMTTSDNGTSSASTSGSGSGNASTKSNRDMDEENESKASAKSNKSTISNMTVLSKGSVKPTPRSASSAASSVASSQRSTGMNDEQPEEDTKPAAKTKITVSTTTDSSIEGTAANILDGATSVGDSVREAARARLRARLQERERQRRGTFDGPRTYPLPERTFVPPTPHVSNAAKNLKYYDFRIFLHQTTEPREHLFTRVGELIREVFRRDRTARLHIYTADERLRDDRVLDNATWENRFQTDDTITFLQRYFHKAIPYFRNGGWQTMRVLMSHDQPFSFLLTEMSEWMKHNGFAIFEKTLQVEQSITVGWAYMSTDKTHKETLAEELAKWCGFPVGLQWRPTSHEGTSTEQVKAIHFEVEYRRASDDRRAICEIYHWDKKDKWPLGMRFRFVPDMVHGTNADAKKSIHRLRRKQANIVRFMGHELTSNLEQVEETYELIEGHSLRSFILSIMSTEAPTTPLFTGVNKHWDSPRYWVSFLPQFEKEAKSMLAGLLPYMRFKFPRADPDKLDLLFSTEYALDMEESEWDDKRRGVTSIYTKQAEMADKNEDDNAWLIGNLDLLDEKEEDPQPVKTSGRKRNLDLDNETVHTIAARTLTGAPNEPEDPPELLVPDAPTPAEAQQLNWHPATPMARTQQIFQQFRSNYNANPNANPNLVTPQMLQNGVETNYNVNPHNRGHYEAGLYSQPTRELPPPAPSEARGGRSSEGRGSRGGRGRVGGRFGGRGRTGGD
jgi:hypothetical protein